MELLRSVALIGIDLSGIVGKVSATCVIVVRRVRNGYMHSTAQHTNSFGIGTRGARGFRVPRGNSSEGSASKTIITVPRKKLVLHVIMFYGVNRAMTRWQTIIVLRVLVLDRSFTLSITVNVECLAILSFNDP